MVNMNMIISPKIRSRLWNSRYCYLLLLPVIANFVIFHYWPMLGLQIAFKKYNIAEGIIGSPWIGFKYFSDFFSSIYFWPLFRNTILISFYCVVFGFPAPIILALLLNESRKPLFKRFVQTVSYMPYFLSTVILVSLVNMFMGPEGIANMIIKNLGGTGISFLQEPQYFRTLYVVSAIWQWTGFSAIIYLAAITSIDISLYEAAELDGAGRLSCIWHITLASIAPTIIIMFILRLGSILDVGWFQILLMQNDMNSQVSDVIQTYVYKKGIMYSDYGYATAVGLFQSIVNLLFVVVSNAISKKASDVSMF